MWASTLGFAFQFRGNGFNPFFGFLFEGSMGTAVGIHRRAILNLDRAIRVFTV